VGQSAAGAAVGVAEAVQVSGCAEAANMQFALLGPKATVKGASLPTVRKSIPQLVVTQNRRRLYHLFPSCPKAICNS